MGELFRNVDYEPFYTVDVRTKLMIYTFGFLLAIAGLIQTQAPPKLTARELFYSAKPASTTQPGNRGASQVSKGAKAQAQVSSGSAGNTASASTAGRQPAGSSGPVIVNASYTPLGLRYGILKRSGAQYSEVDVDSTFQSGDGIRVSIESNDDGYLYIVNRGSSGAWSVLFPSSEIENGNNNVQAHRRYETPARGQFTFVDQPGEERLFVVLSREPEPDLERLIYSLSKPDAAPARPDTSKILITQASITDALVGKLRGAVVARDLVFEKVADETSERKEKAAYVVNATGAASGRVVADLTLKHR